MASSGQARAESKSHQDKIQLLKQAVSSSISPSEFPLIWLCLSSYHFFHPEGLSAQSRGLFPRFKISPPCHLLLVAR